MNKQINYFDPETSGVIKKTLNKQHAIINKKIKLKVLGFLIIIYKH